GHIQWCVEEAGECQGSVPCAVSGPAPTGEAARSPAVALTCEQDHVPGKRYRGGRDVRHERAMERVRDVSRLPKAHLHLHFTGSMSPNRVLELADKHGVRLPETPTHALTSGRPPELRATAQRGWFRFQRLSDAARSCLRKPDDIRRLVREAAEEELRDGSGWLEIQVDPTSYAPRLGGLIPALEIILDAVETAQRDTG